jgi:hypothetical protein
MYVEERREMRNQLRRYDYVLDLVEPNVITGWFVGRLHCFASARRPASVTRTRATSMVLPLAQTRSPPIPRTPIVARHGTNASLFYCPINRPLRAASALEHNAIAGTPWVYLKRS